MIRRHERAEPRLRIERIADRQLGELRLRELDDLGLPRARHQHPRPRRARLPGVLHAVVDARRNRLVERRVVQHDERRLAAKLEGHALDAFARQRGDTAAGLQRSGEAHHVHIGMPDDRLADDATRAADDVEDAGGKTDLVRRVREHQRAERRQLRRLEDDGAAGGESRRDLRDHLMQRIVPRRDAADDADGLLHDERVPELLFLRMLAQELRVQADHRCRELGLHLGREAERRAHFVRDRFRRLRHARLHRGGQFFEPDGALFGRRLTPAVERLARGGNRAADVLRRPTRHAADTLLPWRTTRHRWRRSSRAFASCRRNSDARSESWQSAILRYAGAVPTGEEPVSFQLSVDSSKGPCCSASPRALLNWKLETGN